MEKYKNCFGCKQMLSAELFYFDKTNNVLKSKCKICLTNHRKNTPKSKAYLIYLKKKNENSKIKYSKEWFKKRFYHSKTNCLKSGREFSISYEDYSNLLKEDLCFFCNEIPITKSIDRVNNDIGYTKNNSVMACFKCNILKGRLSMKDISRMEKILKKMKGR